MSGVNKAKRQNHVADFLSKHKAEKIGEISFAIAFINLAISSMIMISFTPVPGVPVITIEIITPLIMFAAIIANLFYIYFEAHHMKIIEEKQKDPPLDTSKHRVLHCITGIIALFAGIIPNIPALIIAVDEFAREAREIKNRISAKNKGGTTETNEKINAREPEQEPGSTSEVCLATSQPQYDFC